MSGPALVLDGVTKWFGGVHALRDASFEVFPGRIAGVIGPNGAGKTTLVNVAGGQLQPDSGRVLLWGRDVTGVSSDRRFRMGLARTFQGLRLYAGLNCYENLLAGVLGGRDFRALHRRAAELMEVFELKPHRSALPASMPFGKQKLLAIGRALMGDPRLVLLDEPFSGLSDAEVAALSEVFKGFAGRRTALGIVEHNLEALAKLADEVTVLDHGVVIASGAPEEVLERPRVHDAYFGGHRKAGVMRLLRQGTE